MRPRLRSVPSPHLVEADSPTAVPNDLRTLALAKLSSAGPEPDDVDPLSQCRETVAYEPFNFEVDADKLLLQGKLFQLAEHRGDVSDLTDDQRDILTITQDFVQYQAARLATSGDSCDFIYIADMGPTAECREHTAKISWQGHPTTVVAARMMHAVAYTHEAVRNSPTAYMMRREFFYKLFQVGLVSESNEDGAFNILKHMAVTFTRRLVDLRWVASNDATWLGSGLSFTTTTGEQITGRDDRVSPIPNMGHIMAGTITIAPWVKGLMLMEKECGGSFAISGGFTEKAECLIIFLKGQSGEASQAMLHAIHRVNPKLALVYVGDLDIGGLTILHNLRWGNIYGVPSIVHLGMRSSDLASLQIRWVPLTERDVKVITNRLDDPELKLDDDIRRELKFLLDFGHKAGVHCVKTTQLARNAQVAIEHIHANLANQPPTTSAVSMVDRINSRSSPFVTRKDVETEMVDLVENFPSTREDETGVYVEMDDSRDFVLAPSKAVVSIRWTKEGQTQSRELPLKQILDQVNKSDEIIQIQQEILAPTILTLRETRGPEQEDYSTALLQHYGALYKNYTPLRRRLGLDAKFPGFKQVVISVFIRQYLLVLVSGAELDVPLHPSDDPAGITAGAPVAIASGPRPLWDQLERTARDPSGARAAQPKKRRLTVGGPAFTVPQTAEVEQLLTRAGVSTSTSRGRPPVRGRDSARGSGARGSGARKSMALDTSDFESSVKTRPRLRPLQTRLDTNQKRTIDASGETFLTQRPPTVLNLDRKKMTRRKKNARASRSKPLDLHFSSKSKPATVSKAAKRQVKRGLTARSSGSRKSLGTDIEPDDVVGLGADSSTSPGEVGSPPTAKRRKLQAIEPAKDHVGSSVSLPLVSPAKQRDDAQRMGISPSPIQSQDHEYHTPDPDEIIESSQTQYLHLIFTPEPPRNGTVDPALVPSPVYKLDLSMPRSSCTRDRPFASHSSGNQDGLAVPTKQVWTCGESSEAGATNDFDASRTPGPSDVPGAGMSGCEDSATEVPSQNRPSSIDGPVVSNLPDRLSETETFLDHISSGQAGPLYQQASPTTNGRVPGASGTSPLSPDAKRFHIDSSPMRNQASPLVIPSAQPTRDSSPLSDCDVGLEMSSQPRTRSRPRLCDQTPPALASRDSGQLQLNAESTQPHSPAHYSIIHSSPSLPPSRSPIKGGRIHPSQSAAGVHRVFGMLGFGSESSYDEDPQMVVPSTAEEQQEPKDAHIPIVFELPPSSPPQSPACEDTTELQSFHSEQNVVIGSPPVDNSPLHRDSPRAPSPLTEDTQTEEEIETPWESLRPSQSVSQVLEHWAVDEDIEVGRRVQMVEDGQGGKGKSREEQSLDRAQDDGLYQSSQEELRDQSLAQPLTTFSNSQSPANVPVGLPPTHQPGASIPVSRPRADHEAQIITDAKVAKQSPVKVHKDSIYISLTSSTGAEEETDGEYTYVEEDYIITESQQSLFQRILRTSSETG